MENDNLYNWVFRYNPIDKKWYAVNRDHYNDLFSDIRSKNVLRSSSISTLMDIINKTNGSQAKINSLIKKDGK